LVGVLFYFFHGILAACQGRKEDIQTEYLVGSCGLEFELGLGLGMGNWQGYLV